MAARRRSTTRPGRNDLANAADRNTRASIQYNARRAMGRGMGMGMGMGMGRGRTPARAKSGH